MGFKTLLAIQTLLFNFKPRRPTFQFIYTYFRPINTIIEDHFSFKHSRQKAVNHALYAENNNFRLQLSNNNTVLVSSRQQRVTNFKEFGIQKLF